MNDIKQTAMITIVGRPNVGKSTLTNALVGEKIAIVSSKPQTTRNRICGVVNRGDTQFVLLDTPGFHRARTRLGDYMVKVVRESVADVDGVCLLVEPIAKVGAPEQAIIPISAQEKDGLDVLMEQLAKYAAPGPQLFPDGMTTDQPERQIVAEIVREKLLRNLDKEVPHGTAIEVTKFSERDSGVIDLDVTIYCEKASHKGIIIGKSGAMLKKIASHAREDIERFMGAKVYMETWVKVKENWRDNLNYVRSFGYDEQ